MATRPHGPAYKLPATVRIALDAAANLIEREGWRQGTHGPGLCLVDAIDKACDTLAMNDLEVKDELRYILTGHTRPLHAWNDQDGRTAHQVVRVLRELAEPDARRRVKS